MARILNCLKILLLSSLFMALLSHGRDGCDVKYHDDGSQEIKYDVVKALKHNYGVSGYTMYFNSKTDHPFDRQFWKTTEVSTWEEKRAILQGPRPHFLQERKDYNFVDGPSESFEGKGRLRVYSEVACLYAMYHEGLRPRHERAVSIGVFVNNEKLAEKNLSEQGCFGHHDGPFNIDFELELDSPEDIDFRIYDVTKHVSILLYKLRFEWVNFVKDEL